jgi:hypothetical protein
MGEVPYCGATESAASCTARVSLQPSYYSPATSPHDHELLTDWMRTICIFLNDVER